MSGNHRSGGRRASSGGYRTGGYGRSGEHRGPGYDDSGPYRRADSGEHPRGGSGSYRRAGSGGYPRGGSGSHRIVHNRPPRRRLAAAVLGAVAGVAACILAVFLVLNMGGGEQPGGGVANTGAADAGTEPNGERSVVPDACTTVGDDLAADLAPNADRTQSDTYQASDRQNQCVWGSYVGKNKRVLTVELRAIAGTGGRTGTDVAGQTFQTEREADRSGKSLLSGHELKDERPVEGVGDEAYAIYSVDGSQGSGEAVVNVRAGNVLVTVHYSGTNDGTELSADDAIDGAIAAAKEAVAALDATG
ncbi:hypothetical protein [Thermomonospora amylolytica]|uniref:hypothetical protein n=1 Tax=Thermomonospora amylolytica TaxID=1411117 RepID=UPI000E6C5195|nr:hypothetical protein [Thermomonospora amylolytica]